MFAAFIRRNIIEPVYEYKTGSQKLTYWKELEKSQYLPEEVLLEQQLKKLKEIITFTYNSNQFYKKRFDEIGFYPSDLRELSDFHHIPILTKEEIQLNLSNLVSDGFREEMLIRFKTGGSTGKPLEVYATEQCSELRNACSWRFDGWAGWRPGEPIGALWGNPVLPRDTVSRLRRRLLVPYIFLDTMKLNEQSVREFVKRWMKWKPTLLFGHAHSIYMFAQYLREMKINYLNPKGIISSSMTLLPTERNLIESVFGKPVFDRYGCEEVSLIAAECEEHQGMHINIEHLVVEFLKDDGQSAKPNEPGVVVVTDLLNQAMPLIRYKVEDVGIPSERKCRCGRGLPLMEGVLGREADFLIQKDGSLVAGISLIENTLTNIPGIKQIQIIQEAIDHIILKVVLKGNENHARGLLENYFKKLFGSQTVLQIKVVSRIEPEKSGKYRFSICKVNSEKQA